MTTEDKNITIQTIADDLGLSASTVSRVLNGVGKKYRISDKTIKAINRVADRLNYSPNQIAKSLRLKKTFTVGLIVPDISNPWFAKIARRIEEESRGKNYRVFLCNSNDDLEIEKESVRLLENWKVDGLVIAPIGLEYEHLLQTWKNDTPMVLVDRYFENIDIPYVASNDLEGAYSATKYLIDKGHRNIACIQGLAGTSTNSLRLQGYRKALEDNGIKVNDEFIFGHDFGFENGYLQGLVIAEIRQKTKITAVFTLGNQSVLGVLKAFKEKEVCVPDDISIITFDNQIYSELLYTPLCTVSHEDEQVGTLAIKLLINQINGKGVFKSDLLPTKLIIRESVKDLSSIK